MKGLKMGFLSSLSSMGTMGLSGLGSTINDMTGASASAAQAQRYAVANAKLNNKFQKEFAQNAHQWEMADLKAAGLNPALTATGGNGASASGGGSFGGSTGTPAGNPFDILNSIVGMQNQTSATKSQNAVNYAAAIKSITEAKWMPYDMKIKMLNALSGQEQAAAATTNATTNKNLGDIELIRKKGTKEYPLGRAAEIGEKEFKKHKIKKAYDKNLKLLRSSLYMHKLPNKY